MEQYSFEKAQEEASRIKEKALKSKEQKNETGELENKDYALAEKDLENENIFLQEGREKWLETVKDYWFNYENNEKIEWSALKNPQKSKEDQLLERFQMGAGDVHHRLVSYIATLSNAFSKKNFHNQEQLMLLGEIGENSTAQGKIKRYTSSARIKRSHPVNEIYSPLLFSRPEIPNEEFELLKKDAYEAGASTALSTSLEEIMSWFYWADGLQYIHEDKAVPAIFFELAQRAYTERVINMTKNEEELLKEATMINRVLQSQETINEKEFDNIIKRSEIARQKWLKSYFSENFSTCPSFSDYLKAKS
jgi:hypothetical protein